MLGGAFLALVAILVLTLAYAALDAGREQRAGEWLSSAVYVLVAAIMAVRAGSSTSKRGPWIVLATGIALYAFGNLLWALWLDDAVQTPARWVSDGLALLLYPLIAVGIAGLARGRGARPLPAGLWLDGIVAGAGLAALGAVLVVGPVLAAASGSPLDQLTQLAYPVGDLLLAALLVGLAAVRGWPLDRTWKLLAAGFFVLAMADSMYPVQAAHRPTGAGGWTVLLYIIAAALLAAAAWQQDVSSSAAPTEQWSLLVVPAGFALVALGLLVYDHVHRLDPVALTLSVLTLLAAIVRMAITFRDVFSLADARRQAATDELTALPNRRLFMARTREAVAAARLAGGQLSVLIIDLDNFKELNDTLGHQAGDALLQLVGPRLGQALRRTDTVARLGGDEFAILLDPQPDEAGVALVADKVLHALREPFETGGLRLRLAASIGIASYPAHARDVNELLKRADVAMYSAKAGRSGYEFYTREHDNNSERLTLAADFAIALAEDQLEVHFQPVAGALSRKIVGVEALVRWRREDGSLLPPGQFVAAAEQAGLSRALTERVLGLALDQLALWWRSGHRVRLSVNTTVADLLDVDFPHQVAAMLDANSLPPAALVLELTESSVMSDPVRIGSVLSQLGELGIQLSLDDFGTGYSSLAHLRELPVGEVKIDRSFVTQMNDDATDAAIVHATVQLAHRLGIRVVAEGVEDRQTWEALKKLGCELVQGYFLSVPLPALELEHQLADPNDSPSAGPSAQPTAGQPSAHPSAVPTGSRPGAQPGTQERRTAGTW